MYIHIINGLINKYIYIYIIYHVYMYILYLRLTRLHASTLWNAWVTNHRKLTTQGIGLDHQS